MGHLIVPQTGVQLFRGEVFLTSLALISTALTAAVVANVAAQSVPVTSSTKFLVGDYVTVDAAGTPETVQITAIGDATHVTGIFTLAHAIGATLTKSARPNVPLGQVQEFDFDDTIDLKEMRGPRSRMAIAVAQSGAKISGSCKFGSTNAQILATIRGAEVAAITTGVGAAQTTLTRIRRKGSQNVIPCAIELFDVDNEYGVHALFTTVVFTDFKNPGKLDDFTVWDATFTVYPDKTTDIVYELFYPGDQTAPYALPSYYGNDADLAGAEADYTMIQAQNANFQPAPTGF